MNLLMHSKTLVKIRSDNGSEHTTDDNGNLMAEFNTNGNVGVLFNGVWNASGVMHRWFY